MLLFALVSHQRKDSHSNKNNKYGEILIHSIWRLSMILRSWDLLNMCTIYNTASVCSVIHGKFQQIHLCKNPTKIDNPSKPKLWKAEMVQKKFCNIGYYTLPFLLCPGVQIMSLLLSSKNIGRKCEKWFCYEIISLYHYHYVLEVRSYKLQMFTYIQYITH